MQLILIVFHSRNDFTAQQCSSWTEQTGWQGITSFWIKTKSSLSFCVNRDIVILFFWVIIVDIVLVPYCIRSNCFPSSYPPHAEKRDVSDLYYLINWSQWSSNKIFVVRLWKYQPDTIGKSEYLLDSMLYETLEFDDDIFAAGEWNNSSVQSCIIWLTRGPAGLVNRAEKYLTENYLMCICQVIVMMPSSTETIHYTVPMRIVCLMARSLPRTSLLNTTTLETAQSGSTMPEQRPRR